MRTPKAQARHRRIIGYAIAYLCCYTLWIVVASFTGYGWPGAGWHFFAGVEFEFLSIFVIGPWLQGRDPYEV